MAWPEDRPETYDEDKVFDESANDWTATLSDLTTTGGEKYKPYFVAVSEQAEIYFGSV